jgi:hypothetical protein
LCLAGNSSAARFPTMYRAATRLRPQVEKPGERKHVFCSRSRCAGKANGAPRRY